MSISLVQFIIVSFFAMVALEAVTNSGGFAFKVGAVVAVLFGFILFSQGLLII